MVAQTWQVAVSQLGGTAPPEDVKVTASNWMGALKAARLELGEEGTVPPGASCAVAPDGTVTVLDAASRRRFTLRVGTAPTAQTKGTESARPNPEPAAPGPAKPTGDAPRPARDKPQLAANPRPSAAGRKKKSPLAQTVGMIPERPMPAPAAATGKPASSKKKSPLAQTVGMIPERPIPAPAAAADKPASRKQKSPLSQTVAMIPEPPPPAPPAQRPRKKFETVAFSVDAVREAGREIVISDRPPPPEPPAAAKPTAEATPASGRSVKPRPFTPPTLELLFERNEDPTPDNPLTYRERAYLIPSTASVMDAEAALRFRLEAVRKELRDTGKGQFVSLAIFDHRWQDQPERPPLVVLEWKDWRGDPMVDYPAAQLSRAAAQAGGSHSASERLAVAFEALQRLEQADSASAALAVVMDVLEQVIPSDATSACLYDIDTDELRFVAVSGHGAAERQGTAVASQDGLLGLALTRELTPTVVGDLSLEPAFLPDNDSRAGLDAHNMLLRPMVGAGRTLGLLQLINRQDASEFSQDDANVLNYVADRVAEALVLLRQHRAS